MREEVVGALWPRLKLVVVVVVEEEEEEEQQQQRRPSSTELELERLH
jgi:hypothetical protein